MTPKSFTVDMSKYQNFEICFKKLSYLVLICTCFPVGVWMCIVRLVQVLLGDLARREFWRAALLRSTSDSNVEVARQTLEKSDPLQRHSATMSSR